jgi:hypothetical protein
MNKPEVVYIVEWFGRGLKKLSQNITKDRKGLQKYIDNLLNRNNNLEIKGNSPDVFTAFDINDRSGICIYSRPVIDKLEHIDLLCPNTFTF